MFVAIRDIRFARGRFALMGSVVLLITLLIVLLSGLTAGLANESTSGIKNLPATHISFGSATTEAPEQKFADSAVTREQVETWSAADGVEWAVPLGITQTRFTTSAGANVPAAVFGVRPGDPISPRGVADGTLVVSRTLAEEENLRAGDTLDTGTTAVRVAAITDDAHYSHSPVVWTSLRTWSELGGQQSATAPWATVIAAKVSDDATLSALDDHARTSTATTGASLNGIGSYSSENGSLLMMQGLLYAISALVIGAFLTVWTIQRTGDIAILKALGASTGYLLRDALVQALVVLTVGAGAGGAAGIGLGALAASAVPFTLTATTTVLPVVAMIVLGMAGAAMAVRRITSVDPLTALGAVR